MGLNSIHAVETYVRTKGGRIGRADVRQCATADGAIRLAERIAQQEKVVGALAFSQHFDAETGEFNSLHIMKSFGTTCNPDEEIPF